MARTETFKATRPDGSVVVVTRNIDTGEQSVSVGDAPGAERIAVVVSDTEPEKRKPGRPRKS